MSMGYPVPSRIRTAIRRDCGHRDTGPSELFDQSKARINAPISPPPDKTELIKFDELDSASASAATEGTGLRRLPEVDELTMTSLAAPSLSDVASSHHNRANGGSNMDYLIFRIDH